MKTLITLALLVSAYSHAGQNIQCFDQDKKSNLKVQIKFPTDDLSKYAKFSISGPNLFEDKGVNGEKCEGFTMRGRKYYNTYVIHNFGCKVWSCSLYIPDTLNGEKKAGFSGRLECFPEDSDMNLWKNFNLNCSSELK